MPFDTRLKESEILWDCAEGLNFKAVAFAPGRNTVPILDSIARLFDCFTVDNVTIEYVPKCSSDTKGAAWCGIDYTVSHDVTADVGVDAVVHLNPSFVTGVFNKSTLLVPTGLWSRQIFRVSTGETGIDKAFGTAFHILMGYNSATPPGLFIINYEVCFRGLSSDLAGLGVRTLIECTTAGQVRLFEEGTPPAKFRHIYCEKNTLFYRTITGANQHSTSFRVDPVFVKDRTFTFWPDEWYLGHIRWIVQLPELTGQYRVRYWVSVINSVPIEVHGPYYPNGRFGIKLFIEDEPVF